MTDTGKKEMQDLLEEGAAALKQMRKGIENACSELRAMYRKAPDSREKADRDGSEVYGRRDNQKNIVYN